MHAWRVYLSEITFEACIGWAHHELTFGNINPNDVDG